MKFLGPRAHGVLDYIIVVTFLLAPALFGFYGLPATLCYVLAAAHLLLSLLTDYPLGAAKIIPFTMHGALEFVIALALVAFPWLLGFSQMPGATSFFVVSGIVVFFIWLVTDYKAAERYARV